MLRYGLVQFQLPMLVLCLLLLSGCHTEPELAGIEIIYHGFQDVDIRSQGVGLPIYVVSEYCGHGKEDPTVLNNGHVVIFISDDEVTMIGWDTENLQEGGIVQIDPSDLDGFSVQHGKRWWLRVAEKDNRFSISE